MSKTTIVKSHDVHLDSEYVKWIHEIKERYRNTQIKAAVKVNAEQLLFNWLLGRDLVTKKLRKNGEQELSSRLVLICKMNFQMSRDSVRQIFGT